MNDQEEFMRAIWSGSISFGLVNIPVKLYSAVGEERISFHLLHSEDLSSIRYAKVCRQEEKEVSKDDIVKGYEYSKGEFVVVDDNDFRKANVRRTSTIEIEGFTDAKSIDSIYYEKPYYLEPAKEALKAYSLLREALKKSGKVGIATFVLKNKEHLAILKPENDIILLDQIRYLGDIRDMSEIRVGEIELKESELEMALSLIRQLEKEFVPSDHKDSYTAELKSLIEEKVKGAIPKPKGIESRPTEVKELMDTLRRSLESVK